MVGDTVRTHVRPSPGRKHAEIRRPAMHRRTAGQDRRPPARSTPSGPTMTELFSDVSRETKGAHRALYARRCFMALFAGVAVLGLLNAFGQEASTSTARASGVSLTLSAPERVRGGLFFQSRVEIRARRRIAHPNLVLDQGWTEG